MASMEQISDCIRALAIDTVQKANSGHPGAPMGMAPVANVLFGKFLKFDSKNPSWFDRDRFVLSNGHASALLYTMLHLCGYKLTLEDLRNFRQLHSITPGHPERGVTEGVEVTTGPLGQGLSNAVGMAIAESHLAATFNKPDIKVIDHYTFVFCGDGCLMEGVACEALSLAGHLGLHKLIVIYDDNNITIDGTTDVAFTEKTADKYTALGFNIIFVNDGNKDYEAIEKAIKEAKASKDKPTMIILKTIIGIGSKLQGTAKVHGSPLGAEEIKAFKSKAGRDPTKSFFVEDEVYAYFKKAAASGADAQVAWNKTMAEFDKKYPADYAVLMARINNELPKDFKTKLPLNGSSIATRKASENALGALFPIVPQLAGGSADLTGSNLTRPNEAKLVDYQRATPAGRYFRFGVREHGMSGIMNGLHAHGGFIPFGGTFLNFIGYAFGAVRLASMSHHQVIYVATHDSIGLGEDGPTHQPTEILAAMRALPNFYVMRPSDQTETSACWALALESKTTPSCLCLSRQNTTPQPTSSLEGVYKGAYTVLETSNPQIIIVASGSEVTIAVETAKLLTPELRVRVVSMPIMQLFDSQPESYKNTVLTEGIPVISVEPYHPLGWDKYSHYHVGLTGFGASAPADQLYEFFGITTQNIAAHCRKLFNLYHDKAPHKRLANWPIK